MKLVRWLTKERNSRAVVTLLAVSVALGSGIVFVWTDVVPTISTDLASGSFADGYRAGKLEATLNAENDALKAQLELTYISQELEREIANMSDDELNKALLDELRRGEF